MKAIQIHGLIKKYNSIPSSWGRVIAGFNLLSTSAWEAAGFYDVVVPAVDNNTQYLGSLEWDADASVFTYPVIDKTWTETVAELKEAKIKELKSLYNNKLSKTDWYIIRESEGGTATPQSILDERTSLRTECGTKEGEINALTTKKAVVSYQIESFI